ncbi:conserved hypothetical protein [Desulfamplus magnetovallimortis]|uniref:YkgJ family cysteine cluster protein n=1 Tax=Desulfamplus magnetovallimortis TaxID=1246637 RepID=A0A1W1H8W0_9BACT|nr:hypothetical protein [Desulfamplus magnetovallimortis]SLM28835.1 conserved hypothetical protein [Desulfamplus magnetovallimortis]
MTLNTNNNIFFNRLRQIYDDMDTEWQNKAAQYGFKCNGCKENCCESEFYHHTFIEKAYLIKGFKTMPLPSRIKTQKRAGKVLKKRDAAAKKGESSKVMCPLNIEEKCMIYPFRPMICRLHGIPHELYTPLKEKIESPGCDAGAPFFEGKYYQFDRTPYYKKIAALEKDFLDFHFNGKAKRIKQTIAHMIAEIRI